jgi:hypothetical protein
VDVNQLAESVVELTRAQQDEAQRSGHLIDVTVEPGAVPPAIGENGATPRGADESGAERDRCDA